MVAPQWKQSEDDGQLSDCGMSGELTSPGPELTGRQDPATLDTLDHHGYSDHDRDQKYLGGHFHTTTFYLDRYIIIIIYLQ